MNDKQVRATLDEGAVAMHEIYSSFLRAGFSEEQAMRLVIHQMALSHECPNHPPREP